MTSFKFFFTPLRRVLNRLQAADSIAPDPFDHCDIQAMDLRQLADLPLPGLPLAPAAQTDNSIVQPPLARCA
jgi:hypothetical protein